MSIRDELREVAVVMESDERARYLILFLQLVSGGSAALYRFYPNWRTSCAYVFLISIGLLLLYTILVVIFYRRYDLNMLYCRKNTGILFDKQLQLHNVAMRKVSFQRVLQKCVLLGKKLGQDVLWEIGEEIGRDFVRCYCEKMSMKSPVRTHKKILIKLLRYDSSSGWGKFELQEFNLERKPHIKIQCRNPLTEDEDRDSKKDSQSDLSQFLCGYLNGICSEILGSIYICKASVSDKYPDGSDYVFVIEIEIRNS
jgi:hypothetical protein